MALGLDRDTLIFDFPEIHPDAVLHVTFQRTLRVPDDGKRHHLPPGLGRFPVRAVDDLAEGRLPPGWKAHGGVAMPMWQSEACWLSFSSPSGYPFLLKVAAGKINAVNGKPWDNAPDFEDQDYVEVPGQPWLDGFCVSKGVVRQFVAMPLGAGYTAEEQITGKAEQGGIQLLAHPLKAALWEARLEERRRREERMRAAWTAASPAMPASAELGMASMASMGAPMGLAPGGSIVQEIAEAKEKPADWEIAARSRCFVHLADSQAWRAITGEAPPTVPSTAADYRRAGLPWFAWYGDGPAKQGSSILAGLASVFTMGQRKGETPLPENETFDPPEPVRLGPQPHSLEGRW